MSNNFSGDSASDLELTDAGSVTSSEDDDESSDEDGVPLAGLSASPTSSTTSFPASVSTASAAAEAHAEREFRAEVVASLARAFAEGHAVDDAAVELKTLRMASNVPLRRVRQEVVGAIVDLVPVVPDPAKQRAEINGVVKRWGSLIIRIGGVDAVDTISILQVRMTVFSSMTVTVT